MDVQTRGLPVIALPTKDGDKPLGCRRPKTEDLSVVALTSLASIQGP